MNLDEKFILVEHKDYSCILSNTRGIYIIGMISYPSLVSKSDISSIDIYIEFLQKLKQTLTELNT